VKTRPLGTTGVEVPVILLGCGNFGGVGSLKSLIGRGLDREQAFAALDEALALGIDVLDTAERYADGESERAIGAWLSARPAAATAHIRIATKVMPPSLEGIDGGRFDHRHIEPRLETSLERIGREKIAFYLSHAPEPATPIEETLEGFAAVVESGRVDHVGCCNVTSQQLLEALDAANRLGVTGFEWVQNGFSLLSPAQDREVRAICRERGLGYTPFSPLAGGVLTGKYRRGAPFPAGSRLELRPEGVAERLVGPVYDALDKLQQFAAARGVSCAALSLAWLMSHPDCTALVVGPPRTPPHMGHVAEALDVTLTPEDHALLAGWFEAAANRIASW
jgi:aryl-alcohol dehydrogenase-like predicted oxidoreductase